MNVNPAPAGTPVAPPLWKAADVADVYYLQKPDWKPWQPIWARPATERTFDTINLRGTPKYAGDTWEAAVKIAQGRTQRAAIDQVVLEHDGHFFTAGAKAKLGAQRIDIDELEGKINSWQKHDADDAVRVRKTLSDAQAYVSDGYVADLRRSGNPNRIPRANEA